MRQEYSQSTPTDVCDALDLTATAVYEAPKKVRWSYPPNAGVEARAGRASIFSGSRFVSRIWRL